VHVGGVVNRWSGFGGILHGEVVVKAMENVGRQRSIPIFATMEKGELRPEVVVDCELREGEAMIV